LHLTKVILENFQSHSYSEFSLDKNLNVIVGISNQGKTSLVRALSLVLFNQWDKSWVSNGEKFCKITLITSEGITVTREKGDKINKYILEFNNGMQQVYENFGVSVPEAVQKALRIHEVQIDSKDSINLNLSTQLENLFLLSQPNSYKAKVFGKLSGAHILDSAIREINREARSFSTEKGIKEKELVELQGQVDKLAKIELFSTVVNEIEEKLASVAVQEGRIDAIRSLLERVKGWKGAWTQETTKEAALANVEVGNIEQLVQKSARLSTLSLLLGKITSFKAVSEKQSKLQSLLSAFSLDVIPEKVQKVERVKILKDIVKRITGNNTEFNSVEQNLRNTEKQHEEASKQYNNLLKEAGVCPICGVSTRDLSNV
jgi:exonuclease SbcC